MFRTQQLARHIYVYPLTSLKPSERQQILRTGKIWFNFAELDKRPAKPKSPLRLNQLDKQFSLTDLRFNIPNENTVLDYLSTIIDEPLTIHHLHQIYQRLSSSNQSYRQYIIRDQLILHPLPDEIWILMQWIMHDYQTKKRSIIEYDNLLNLINFISNFLFIRPFPTHNEVIAQLILNKELSRLKYGACIIDHFAIIQYHLESCFYGHDYEAMYSYILREIRRTNAELIQDYNNVEY